MITAIFLLSLYGPGHSFAGEGRGNNGANPAIGNAFAGEELTYNIGFWLFEGVAVGKVRLERNGPLYVATLSAYTTGLSDWLKHREDTYTAKIEEVEGGRRFRTLSFEEDVIVGSKKRKILTEIDYKRGVVKWRRWKNEKLSKTLEFPVKPGITYDDPLTAFYNFRYGAYGPIEEGRRYTIRTFPGDKEKEVDIGLSIVTGEERKKRAGDKEGYLADVKLAKELFDSSSGEIEVLFDKRLVPMKAVARDIVFFGDVRGTLVPSRR
ncbi:MAG: DUF3108 domain-containing protein [Deltaproteobacteria bacterium]|nr:DUF3108 domain-containing protein [Deltaproteobacteria bacterium]